MKKYVQIGKICLLYWLSLMRFFKDTTSTVYHTIYNAYYKPAINFRVISRAALRHVVRKKPNFEYFLPRDWHAFLLSIQVSKNMLKNYELVNHKQRWIFEFLIQGLLREFILDDNFLTSGFYNVWKLMEGYEINKLLSGLLVCRPKMSHSSCQTTP